MITIYFLTHKLTHQRLIKMTIYANTKNTVKNTYEYVWVQLIQIHRFANKLEAFILDIIFIFMGAYT